VYDFIYVNSNFRSIFNRFGDIAGFVRPEQIFSHPTPIPAKIWGISVMLLPAPAERERVRLISREIIFQEFQPT